MSSQVSICNLALSYLGKPNISSLDEASTEARLCNQFYDHTLGTLLQSFPWTFAGETVALAEVANTKSQRWSFAYRRPPDCLKARRVTDSYMLDYVSPVDGGILGGHPYALEATTIFCDLSPAYLEYTKRVDDPSLFPPLFIDALGYHLAVRLSMPVTRDPKVRADAYQLAIRMQAEAASQDANEHNDTSITPVEHLEARR